MRLVHLRDAPFPASPGNQPALFQGKTCPQLFSKGHGQLYLLENVCLGFLQGSWQEFQKISLSAFSGPFSQRLSPIETAAIQTEVVSEGMERKGKGQVRRELGVGTWEGPGESGSDRALDWKPQNSVMTNWLAKGRCTRWTWEKRLAGPWEMCTNERPSEPGQSARTFVSLSPPDT